jgi:hypothetical protein
VYTHSDAIKNPLLPKLQITLNFEHFPETFNGLIYFTVSYSINASDEEVFVSHSV